MSSLRQPWCATNECTVHHSRPLAEESDGDQMEMLIRESQRLRCASSAGGSGVFFEKGCGFFSDVLNRQQMPIIGIENELVGFFRGLEGVAQEICLLDGNH